MERSVPEIRAPRFARFCFGFSGLLKRIQSEISLFIYLLIYFFILFPILSARNGHLNRLTDGLMNFYQFYKVFQLRGGEVKTLKWPSITIIVLQALV